MTEKNSKLSNFYAGLTVLLWSTAASAFKLGLSDTNAAHLLFYSSLTSFFVFALFRLMSKNRKKLFETNNLLKSALFGLINPFIYYLILFEAYSLLPAQIAQPLNYTWVIVVNIMMALFMHKKLDKSSLFGLFVSFWGVVIISAQGQTSELGNISIWGIVLALSSSIFWGLYWVLNLRDTRRDVDKLLSNFMFGTLFIFLYLIITQDFNFTTNGVIAGVYIGLFEMGITFFIWLKALKYSKNTVFTGNIIYFTPFVSLIFIYFVLGEPIRFASLIGLVLIIGGIFLPKILGKNKLKA
ncbi:MAG: DMT family transporter [Candidatus Kapaibacterium sp.]|jgi:drug/metabolite transporter (DMT)-like permease|nr:DMT family transporter [Candidatus Kapabacteria bacterium]